MTDVDTAELRRLAEAATQFAQPPWVMTDGYDNRIEDVFGNPIVFADDPQRVYIAAVSPDVLVALLDRLERAEGERDAIKAEMHQRELHHFETEQRLAETETP